MASGRNRILGLAAVVLVGGCSSGPGNPPPATYTDPPVPPAATEPPGADNAEPALRALGQLITRQDLTFHVTETVATTGGGVEATVDLDVAGSDFVAVVTVPGTKRIELRHVGGATFARVGTGKWRSGTADERLLDDLANPWLYLCWLDDLGYTGPAEGTPDALAFACRQPFAYQSLTMRQEGKVGRIESLTLVVLADGTPVHMDLSGSGPTMATNSETFKASYVFSRVGERIVVKAPKG